MRAARKLRTQGINAQIQGGVAPARPWRFGPRVHVEPLKSELTSRSHLARDYPPTRLHQKHGLSRVIAAIVWAVLAGSIGVEHEANGARGAPDAPPVMPRAPSGALCAAAAAPNAAPGMPKTVPVMSRGAPGITGTVFVLPRRARGAPDTPSGVPCGASGITRRAPGDTCGASGAADENLMRTG